MLFNTITPVVPTGILRAHTVCEQLFSVKTDGHAGGKRIDGERECFVFFILEMDHRRFNATDGIEVGKRASIHHIAEMEGFDFCKPNAFGKAAWLIRLRILRRIVEEMPPI